MLIHIRSPSTDNDILLSVEGDGTDTEDLNDILYHNLDNPDVMAVLREYFEER